MGKHSHAPDPYATAAAQTQSNKETANYNAALNRIDQYTPFGSSVYTVAGTGADGVPQYRQDVTLTPLAQQQLDNQLKQDAALSNLGFNLGDQASDALKGGIDLSGLPALRGGATPGQLQTSIADVPGLTTAIAPSGQIQTGLDFSGAPRLYGASDLNAANLRTQAAQYAQAASRLDPQWTNAQHDLDAKLANQGVVQGSEAWQRDQDELGRQRNDAYNQAVYSAIGAGNQEQQNLFGNSLAARQQSVGETEAQGNFANQAQQQLFGQNSAEAAFRNAAQQQAYDQALSRGQFANAAQAQAFAQAQAANQANNAARAQGLQEQTALRDLPLNELNALRASTQIQNPQFSSVPQAEMANTDISGDIYKSAEMQQQASNGFMSGLFGLGSSLLGAAGQAKGFGPLFSDRRLKRDIVRVGTTPVLGLPLYAFSYVWDRGRRAIGVMADEVARVRPSAVVDHPSGFKAVDYGQIA
jgi:chemotaxis protein histidine kinase CheA